VLVRLFFAFGSCAGASASVAGGASAFSAAPAVVDAFAMWSDGSFRLTDLRLRAPAGGGGCAADAKDSCGAVVAGWILGSSVDGANWELCCVLAAMGEGFRLRLEAGEVLWQAARTALASSR
jgi:hypothetical protein